MNTPRLVSLWRMIRAKGWILPLALALISTVLFWLLSPRAASQITQSEETLPFDNLLPEGFVLVPIEVENMEALDSVVGSFGLVDLYAHQQGGKPRKVGSRMKMVRSQPGFVSLLVPEDEALKLLGEPGPFRVAVLNPHENKGATALHRPRSSRIIYQDK